MRKKLGLLLVAGVLTCALFAGCAKTKTTTPAATQETTEENKDNPSIGGLTGAYDFSEAVGSLTADQKKLFESVKDLPDGVTLEPIALLGSQIVSGTNYAYLCKSTTVTAEPVTSLSVVIIYSGLSGEPSFTCATEFDVDAVMANTGSNNEELSGAYVVPEEFALADVDADTTSAFANATNGYTGVNISIRAILGKQIVAGTNYLAVAATTPVVQDAVTGVSLVKVYVDASGKASVEGVYTIDVASYNK